ncbi:acyl carrier protein [Luteimonas sp. SJ-92]|uniref:Acyl carrier protein n=1 Tax=Luteimonas salinisoli TaxID=2752307 RepID=A0A853JE63_9GAMM|nr:acyl carrier protein [Luteimonas salinisoli]NZA27621.1 acyl carrier protein [Luteimonas salinisoli]
MDKQTILHRLSAILQDKYDVKDVSVEPETKLSELGIDSMITADLMLEIEDALGFTFTNMEMPRNATVQDVVDVVHQHLGSSAS